MYNEDMDISNEAQIMNISLAGLTAGSAAASGVELVTEGDFTNTFTIEDLDGDVDGIYILEYAMRHNSAFQLAALRVNDDDVNANYKSAIHEFGRVANASHHTVATYANGNGGFVLTANSGTVQSGRFRIDATSGKVRVFDYSNFSQTDSGNFVRTEAIGYWTETVPNITKLHFFTGEITQGHYQLFKET